MRLLSKLRHPCILPIMGVVMDKGKQPMLVTELLEIGSLSALLKNESVVLGSDLIMPIIEVPYLFFPSTPLLFSSSSFSLSFFSLFISSPWLPSSFPDSLASSLPMSHVRALTNT
jgi:hypothetical protein